MVENLAKVRETRISKERREEIEGMVKVLLIQAMSDKEIVKSLRFKDEMVIADEISYANAMKEHWIELTQIRMGTLEREFKS